jgi:hypothetical protein
MSVRTTFDEKKEEARDALSVAIKSIQVSLDEETWGYSDIKSEFIDELAEINCQLIKIKRKL